MKRLPGTIHTARLVLNRWTEPLRAALQLKLAGRRMCVVLAFPLLAWGGALQADTVHFAGVSFISNHNEIAERFPNSSVVLSEAGGEQKFNALLGSLITRMSNPQVAVESSGTLADFRNGETRALSFAVSAESVETQRVEGRYLARYMLSSQVMFFDMSEPKRLVASYPVRVAYSHMTAAKPSEAEIRATFWRMYFDTSHPANLSNKWIEKLASVNPKDGTKLLRVRTVRFEDKAAAALPNSANPSVLAAEFAQFLESSISDRTGMPLVPFTNGQAIAGKIKLRFANGADIDLEKMPTETFAFDLTIREFRRIQEDVGPAWQTAYGAFVSITATSVALSTELMNGKFRQVLTVVSPKQSAIVLDDWAQHRTVLFGLLDQLAGQLQKPDLSWYGTASSTPDIGVQLTRLAQRLQ